LLFGKGDKKDVVACGLAEGANASYFLDRGGSPAARGRDDICHRLIAT